MLDSLSQTQVKRLTAVHGWSGVILGLLLYAVVITGTVVVFADEIETWSLGGTGEEHSLSGIPGVDAKVRDALFPMGKGYLKEVQIRPTIDGHLRVFPHVHAVNPKTGELGDLGRMMIIDRETGAYRLKEEGFSSDNPHWFEGSALSEFLVDVHVQLYMPRPWGLIVTGILGLLTMAAGVTGLLMHRHVIRDLFVAERPGARLVSSRDRHVLAASWSLPFTFLLGFTGSFLSFAISIGLPMMAMVAFGGDREKMIETLLAAPKQEDHRPVPSTDLNAVIADAAKRAGGPVNAMTVMNYGRADAVIQTSHDAQDGEMMPVNMVYDGASGAFMGEKPLIGKQASVGGTLVELVFPLHFGSFAGVLSKSVWVGLGGAMCFVILSGLRLWVKRRGEDALWRNFGVAVVTVGYGLPFAMVASAHAFFLARYAGDAAWWTGAGFLIGAALGILIGLALRESKRLGRTFCRLLAAGCLLLPVIRMATGGAAWIGSGGPATGAVIAIDMAFLLMGAGLWYATGRGNAQPADLRPEPAE